MHQRRHLTAEAIFALVRDQSEAINLATVYRTLDFLVREGLINRTDLGDGSFIYTTADHGSHLHLVCSNCQQITEASYEMLASLQHELSCQYGFQAHLHHLAITGLCEHCREEQGVSS